MVALDSKSQKELLLLARRTLECYLSAGTTPEFNTNDSALLQRAGAFVSLHKGDELRGCIGQIAPDRELYRVVQACTLSAALNDFRFSPVTAEEVRCLKIEISVLAPLKRVSSVEKIEVGRHGLYVTQGNRRGLLLPQVATQYSWDREVFLAQTCRKAGLAESAWRDSSTAIRTFEAQVFSEPH